MEASYHFAPPLRILSGLEKMTSFHFHLSEDARPEATRPLLRVPCAFDRSPDLPFGLCFPPACNERERNLI